MSQHNLILLIFICVITIIGRKSSHLGSFYRTDGWDLEDLFCAYEILLTTVVLRFIQILNLYDETHYPIFHFSWAWVVSFLRLDLINQAGKLLLFTAIMLFQKKVSMRLHTKSTIEKVVLIAVHNYLSCILFLNSLGFKNSEDVSWRDTISLFIFAYLIFREIYMEKVKIRKEKTLQDTIEEINAENK